MDNDNTQAVGATLGAGRNVNLTAQYDVTLEGAELSAAKNVTLAADNNIAIGRIYQDIYGRSRDVNLLLAPSC